MNGLLRIKRIWLFVWGMLKALRRTRANDNAPIVVSAQDYIKVMRMILSPPRQPSPAMEKAIAIYHERKAHEAATRVIYGESE